MDTDYQHIAAKDHITKQFKKGEKVLASILVDKTNENGKVQQRTLLLTTLSIYNINDKAMRPFVQPVKRVIGLDRLVAVIVSESS